MGEKNAGTNRRHPSDGRCRLVQRPVVYAKNERVPTLCLQGGVGWHHDCGLTGKQAVGAT